MCTDVRESKNPLGKNPLFTYGCSVNEKYWEVNVYTIPDKFFELSGFNDTVNTVSENVLVREREKNGLIRVRKPISSYGRSQNEWERMKNSAKAPSPFLQKILHYDGKGSYAYLEFLDHSLWKVMKIVKSKNLEIPEHIVSKIAFYSLKCLEEIHKKKNGYHGNLKPTNIYIQTDGTLHNGNIKFSEYQLPNINNQMKKIGNLRYYPSTRLNGLAITNKDDIWSLGVVLSELVTSRYPLPINTSNYWEMSKGIRQYDGPVPDTRKEDFLSDELEDFLSQMLHLDHEKRKSAEELLKCRFLRDENVFREPFLKDWLAHIKCYDPKDKDEEERRLYLISDWKGGGGSMKRILIGGSTIHLFGCFLGL